MTEDQKAFEAWYLDNGSSKNAIEKDNCDNYKFMQAHINWTAWQAACEYKETQNLLPWLNIRKEIKETK